MIIAQSKAQINHIRKNIDYSCPVWYNTIKDGDIMRGTYCKKCNRFLYTNKTEHYCRKCGTLLAEIPMDYEQFTALSLTERYKLAYKLTKNDG